MASEHTRAFDGESFASVVGSEERPVVVDFWAPWCAPCRAIAPAIDRLAERFEGRAVIGKVNVDDVPQLAAEYRVQSIPTILVFRDGRPVKRLVGLRGEDGIAEAIEEAASSVA